MNRTSWKCLLIGAVVAIALSSVAAQADAQWAGYYRPAAWGCCYAPRYIAPCYSCYSPCYATVGCGSCYDGAWYLGCRPGPVRRLLLGPYRWYWAGGCGYSCSYGGCLSSCDTCGSDVMPGTPTPAQPTQAPTPAKKPVMEPPAAMPIEPAPAPALPGPNAPLPGLPGPSPVMPKTSATSANTSGIVTVWVPYDAKVTINGLETRSAGSRREFVSYGLKSGLSYRYVVHAQVVREGKILEDTQTVTLTAGQIEAVAFGFNTQPPTEQVASR
jgi:uncharacterized protein (TIGR03000 family)